MSKLFCFFKVSIDFIPVFGMKDYLCVMWRALVWILFFLAPVVWGQGGDGNGGGNGGGKGGAVQSDVVSSVPVQTQKSVLLI